MRTNQILRPFLTVIFAASIALLLTSCGDSGSGSGSCDPDTNLDCVCETEAGQACDDPDDLDCFCFIVDDGPNNGGAVDETTVEIFDAAFTPQSVTINVGGSVRWENNDTVQHTVTFADTSGIGIDMLLNPGESFVSPAGAFDTAGTFTYSDRLNSGPGLTGTVIVQ